jgi:hypothetical protein
MFRYDPSFVGFGWNKITQVETLDARGFEFFVLPDVFIIHTPHAPSSSLSAFRQSTDYKECIALFYREFRAGLDRLKTQASAFTIKSNKEVGDVYERAVKRKAERLRQQMNSKN